jgi:hypothetical protein
MLHERRHRLYTMRFGGARSGIIELLRFTSTPWRK